MNQDDSSRSLDVQARLISANKGLIQPFGLRGHESISSYPQVNSFFKKLIK